MQKGRSEPVQDSVSKPILLGLITALVIGVMAPLVVPHATHPSMIFHITLHIASLTIAVFLSIVSFIAYRRSTGARLLLMALGFSTLAVVEFFYLLDSTGTLLMFEIPEINIELPHVILLVMLTMFGLGVLKVNK
jgi:hypothetical protein